MSDRVPIVASRPPAEPALTLGIDRFMAECRSLSTFIGNAVAAIVVARWEAVRTFQSSKRAYRTGQTPPSRRN